jgi:hypothetical protein
LRQLVRGTDELLDRGRKFLAEFDSEAIEVEDLNDASRVLARIFDGEAHEGGRSVYVGRGVEAKAKPGNQTEVLGQPVQVHIGKREAILPGSPSFEFVRAVEMAATMWESLRLGDGPSKEVVAYEDRRVVGQPVIWTRVLA